MKRSVPPSVWAAFGFAFTISGCGQAEPAAVVEEAPAAAAASASTAADAAAPAPSMAAAPAAPGAPSFAVIYPGGRISAPATLAQGPSGPGGMVAYTTEATPDAVIVFHRARAEAAGLKLINAMNQNGARGYSAGDGADGRGLLLDVVATPSDDGPTDVMLSWSAGR